MIFFVAIIERQFVIGLFVQQEKKFPILDTFEFLRGLQIDAIVFDRKIDNSKFFFIYFNVYSIISIKIIQQ